MVTQLLKALTIVQSELQTASVEQSWIPTIKHASMLESKSQEPMLKSNLVNGSIKLVLVKESKSEICFGSVDTSLKESLKISM